VPVTEYLRNDIAVKKQKDYYYVMRKGSCFFIFFFMLIAVALFAVNYLSDTLSFIPKQFTAAFVDVAPKIGEEGEIEGEGEESAAPIFENVTLKNADGEEGEEDDEEDAEPSDSFNGVTYNLLDPVFGFLKWAGAKVNMNIDLGESPMYDELMSRVELGMDDPIAKYTVYAYPVLLIAYIITAVVMLFKALLSLFGKRIYKNFVLGSVIMLIGAVAVLLSGLVYSTEVGESLNFGGITDVLMNFVSGKDGFAAGYGMLGLIGLPVFVLLLSFFSKRRVPYSIFDNAVSQ